jgi:cytidyltransferase-like protein
MNESNKKTVMVFGVFDGFHEGHRFFLRAANAWGDYLIVVVARDEYVERIKHHIPKHALKERMKTIEDAGIANEVCPADQKEGTWSLIREKQPDIIAIGYDQDALAEALCDAMPACTKQFCIVRIQAYKPEQYQSSILDADKM